MKKLISFVKKFTGEEIPELRRAERIGRGYCLMDEELKKARESIKAEPFSAGLFLGELKEGKFKPGFPLLDLIASHSDKKAIIGSKGETMFLYGRHVLEESIAKAGADEGPVIVENEKGDVLGYGEVKKDREGNKIIKNFLHRGDFLKRESKRSSR